MIKELPPRVYHILDSEVVTQAVQKLAYLLIHKAALQRKYGAVITEELIAEYTRRVERARETPSDLAMLGHQAVETEILHSFKERFIILHKDICIGAVFGFPANSAVHAELGVNGISAILASADSFHKYMMDFASFWAKHGAVLGAKGCPPTMGDDMAALERDFMAQKTARGTSKDDRHTMACERIDNLNAIWDLMLKFEACAEGTFGAGTPTSDLFHVYRGARAKVEEPAPKPPKTGGDAAVSDEKTEA